VRSPANFRCGFGVRRRGLLLSGDDACGLLIQPRTARIRPCVPVRLEGIATVDRELKGCDARSFKHNLCHRPFDQRS
jgi:hypothetical protein